MALWSRAAASEKNGNSSTRMGGVNGGGGRGGAERDRAWGAVIPFDRLIHPSRSLVYVVRSGARLAVYLVFADRTTQARGGGGLAFSRCKHGRDEGYGLPESSSPEMKYITLKQNRKRAVGVLLNFVHVSP